MKISFEGLLYAYTKKRVYEEGTSWHVYGRYVILDHTEDIQIGCLSTDTEEDAQSMADAITIVVETLAANDPEFAATRELEQSLEAPAGYDCSCMTPGYVPIAARG